MFLRDNKKFQFDYFITITVNTKTNYYSIYALGILYFSKATLNKDLITCLININMQESL